MADDRIKQQVELEGGEQVARGLEQIGDTGERAFDRLGRSADRARFDRVEKDIRQTADATGQLGDASQRASGDVDQLTASSRRASDETHSLVGVIGQAIRQVGVYRIAIAAATGAVTGFIGSVVGFTRSAASATSELGRAADAADLTVRKYQSLLGSLRGLGLTSEEATGAIKEIGKAADELPPKFSQWAAALINATSRTGQRFVQNAAGMALWRRQMVDTASRMVNLSRVSEDLDEVLKKFEGTKSPEAMVQFANELGKVAQKAQLLGSVMGDRAGGMRVITVPQTLRTAVESTENLRDALGDITATGLDSQKLTRFIGELSRVETEVDQIAQATKLIPDDEDFGENLVKALREGTTEGAAYRQVIESLRDVLSGIDLETFQNDFSAMATLFQRNSERASQMAENLERMKKEGLSTQGISAFVKELSNFTSETDQAGKSAALLGDKALGQDFVDALKEGSTESEAFRRVYRALADTLSATDLDKFKSDFAEISEQFRQSSRAAERFRQVKTPIENVRDAMAELKENASPVNLLRFAQALSKIDDESRVAELATEALGKRAGTQLAAAVQKGGSAVEDLLFRYQKLRLAATDAQRVIADDFNAALAETGEVIAANRRELMEMFAPSIIPIIQKFNELIRRGEGGITGWARAIQQNLRPVFDDLLKVMSGVDDSQIENKWILRLRDAFVEVGRAAEWLFQNIILPGLAALDRAAQAAVQKINELFGTNFTLADVGLVSIVTWLIGGFNALALAIAAAFAADIPALDDFRKLLKSIGIDVEQIKGVFTGARDDLRLFGVDFTSIVRTIREAWAEFRMVMSGGAQDPISGRTTEIGKQLEGFRKGIKQLVGDAPGTVAAIGGIAAAVIRFVGPSRAAAAVVLQLTGVLDVLRGILATLATAIGLVGAALFVLSKIFEGTAFGRFLLLITSLGLAFLLFVKYMDKVKIAAGELALALNSLLGTRFTDTQVALAALGTVVAGIVAVIGLLILRSGAAARALGGLGVAMTFLARHPLIIGLGLLAAAMLLLTNNGRLAKRVLESFGVEAETAEKHVSQFTRVIDRLSLGFSQLSQGFSDITAGNFRQGIENIQQGFSSLWDALKEESAATWAVLGLGGVIAVRSVVNVIQNALLPLLARMAPFLAMLAPFLAAAEEASRAPATPEDAQAALRKADEEARKMLEQRDAWFRQQISNIDKYVHETFSNLAKKLSESGLWRGIVDSFIDEANHIRREAAALYNWLRDLFRSLNPFARMAEPPVEAQVPFPTADPRKLRETASGATDAAAGVNQLNKNVSETTVATAAQKPALEELLALYERLRQETARAALAEPFRGIPKELAELATQAKNLIENGFRGVEGSLTDTERQLLESIARIVDSISSAEITARGLAGEQAAAEQRRAADAIAVEQKRANEKAAVEQRRADDSALKQAKDAVKKIRIIRGGVGGLQGQDINVPVRPSTDIRRQPLGFSSAVEADIPDLEAAASRAGQAARSAFEESMLARGDSATRLQDMRPSDETERAWSELFSNVDRQIDTTLKAFASATSQFQPPISKQEAEAVSNRLGTVTDVADRLRQIFSSMGETGRGAVQQLDIFATDFVEALRNAKDIDAFDILLMSAEEWLSRLPELAQNTKFIDVEKERAELQQLMLEIGQQFDGLKPRIDAAFEQLRTTGGGTALPAISSEITQSFATAQESAGIFSTSLQTIVDQSTQISSAINQIFIQLSDSLRSTEAQMLSSIQNIVQALDAAILKMAQLRQSGGTGAPAPGFSSGGHFRGRPGRDANLAWLTNNEFVMRVDAVKKYGLAFMHAINSGRFADGGRVKDGFPAFQRGGVAVSGTNPQLVQALTNAVQTVAKTMSDLINRAYEIGADNMRDATRQRRGFYQGGLAGGSLAEALTSFRGFDAGGVVSSLTDIAPRVGGASVTTGPLATQATRPLTLVLDGQRFPNLQGPADVVDNLEKFAVRRRTYSAGRSPFWVNG